MTKFINNLDKRKGNTKTEFVSFIIGVKTIAAATSQPHRYDYVELMLIDEGFDVMLAWHKKQQRKEGIIYLGYWNDGC